MRFKWNLVILLIVSFALIFSPRAEALPSYKNAIIQIWREALFSPQPTYSGVEEFLNETATLQDWFNRTSLGPAYRETLSYAIPLASYDALKQEIPDPHLLITKWLDQTMRDHLTTDPFIVSEIKAITETIALMTAKRDTLDHLPIGPHKAFARAYAEMEQIDGFTEQDPQMRKALGKSFFKHSLTEVPERRKKDNGSLDLATLNALFKPHLLRVRKHIVRELIPLSQLGSIQTGAPETFEPLTSWEEFEELPFCERKNGQICLAYKSLRFPDHRPKELKDIPQPSQGWVEEYVESSRYSVLISPWRGRMLALRAFEFALRQLPQVIYKNQKGIEAKDCFIAAVYAGINSESSPQNFPTLFSPSHYNPATQLVLSLVKGPQYIQDRDRLAQQQGLPSLRERITSLAIKAQTGEDEIKRSIQNVGQASSKSEKARPLQLAPEPDKARNKSKDVLKESKNKSFFELEPLRIGILRAPRHFHIPRPSSTEKLINYTPTGKEAFRMRSTTALELSDGVIPVLRLLDRKVAQVDLFSTEGQQLHYPADYQLLVDPGTEDVFIKPSEHLTYQSFQIKIGYSDKIIEKSADVDDETDFLDVNKVRELIGLLRQGLLLKLAAETEHFLNAHQKNTVVATQDIANIFKNVTRYSYDEAFCLKAQEGASGPFADFSGFVGTDNALHMQCDGSGDLWALFLENYFGDKPHIEVRREFYFVRDRHSPVINGSDGHRIIHLLKHGKLVRTYDTTASKEGAAHIRPARRSPVAQNQEKTPSIQNAQKSPTTQSQLKASSTSTRVKTTSVASPVKTPPPEFLDYLKKFALEVSKQRQKLLELESLRKSSRALTRDASEPLSAAMKLSKDVIALASTTPPTLVSDAESVEAQRIAQLNRLTRLKTDPSMKSLLEKHYPLYRDTTIVTALITLLHKLGEFHPQVRAFSAFFPSSTQTTAGESAPSHSWADNIVNAPHILDYLESVQHLAYTDDFQQTLKDILKDLLTAEPPASAEHPLPPSDFLGRLQKLRLDAESEILVTFRLIDQGLSPMDKDIVFGLRTVRRLSEIQDEESLKAFNLMKKDRLASRDRAWEMFDLAGAKEVLSLGLKPEQLASLSNYYVAQYSESFANRTAQNLARIKILCKQFASPMWGRLPFDAEIREALPTFLKKNPSAENELRPWLIEQSQTGYEFQKYQYQVLLASAGWASSSAKQSTQLRGFTGLIQTIKLCKKLFAQEKKKNHE